MCSLPFVVFVVVIVVRTAAVVMVMCIYFYNYEHTSYTLVVSSVMSQWCDNDNHDLPQHVIGTVKWRDDVDGNKCRSIIISFIPVNDNISICTCHYSLFPFLLLHAKHF